MQNSKIIILTGATGVGKTDISLEIAKDLNAEIINADVGQFYKPLSIGTAKPAWEDSDVPHHLFDIMSFPAHYTVSEYRNVVLRLINDIQSRKNIPIVVGGSGFYIKSLLFPPNNDVARKEKNRLLQHESEEFEDGDAWERLNHIDPLRAAALHPHDSYRIERALSIWERTGIKPSFLKPNYDPPCSLLLVNLTRNRDELYDRINDRVLSMIKDGWLDEVRNLIGTEWEAFIQNKKIIGYNELIAYGHSAYKSEQDYENVIKNIQQRTRHYAKRQETLWRGLSAMIEQYHKDSLFHVITTEYNLSIISQDRVIRDIIALYTSIKG